MCLDSVDKVIKKGRGYGYKVFKQLEAEYYPYYAFLSVGGPYKEGEWIISKGNCSTVVASGEGTYIFNEHNTIKYHVGFHVLASKKHNLGGGVLRKVMYGDVVASGTEWKRQVYIARKIYICKGEVS